MAASVQLAPTYHGFIASTTDALILFEACLSGRINHVARRPHDREREHVIKSGNIFIYEEHSSGIKRWTDGVSWSPSRILGNFLIYRQLQKPFGPGEKKKALKRSKGPTGVVKNTPQTATRLRTGSVSHHYNSPSTNASVEPSNQISVDVERSLIGSLVDSYDFMDEGLVKKTISVTYGEATHHLVSYYTMADAMISNKFIVPSKDPAFHNLAVRTELLTKQNFRTPIEDIDPMERSPYGRSYSIVSQNMNHTDHDYSTSPEHHGYHLSTAMYPSNGYSQLPASVVESGIAQYAPPPYTTSAPYVPSPGIYAAPSRSEQYAPPYEYRQRYSVTSTTSSDGSRAQMPPAANTHRRSSTFQNSVSSEDSGISMTIENRPPTESTYTPSTSSYYPPTTTTSLPREDSSGAAQVAHKPLSNIENRPAVYDRSAPLPTGYRLPVDTKDAALWSLHGNASVGHGHYQPQWASASH